MVNGVTYLHNVLYIVCEKSAYIDMYTADTLSPLGEGIHVEDMKNPTDIVVCRHGRQLYVPDSGECIWAVSVDAHSRMKWLPTESKTGRFNVTSLSVTSQRLLVTSQRRKLYHMTDTTTGWCEVSLPEYVSRVEHAAETTHRKCVVCYQGTFQHSKQHAVSH